MGDDLELADNLADYSLLHDYEHWDEALISHPQPLLGDS